MNKLLDVNKRTYIISNEILTYKEMMELLEKSDMSAIEVSDTYGYVHVFLNKSKWGDI